MTIRCLFPVAVWGALLVSGCGSSTTPEPETPAAEPAEGALPKPEAEPAAKADEPAPATPADPPAYDPSNPKNVLLKEGTAFMLNHRASDMGTKAEEACAKKAKDDVAKKANCLSTAINKMDREGMMFDEDDAGAWWFVRIGIVKGAKVEYNRVQIEVGEPSGKSLTIKTTGPDKAARKKGVVPDEMTFEVPDEYTVILQHPDKGKMVFEPKMGLFNE